MANQNDLSHLVFFLLFGGSMRCGFELSGF